MNTLPSFGASVRISKVSSVKNPVAESGSWENWIPGSLENTGSLPVDYELEGVLLAPLIVGGRIQAYRTSRNGIKADGLFESTAIVRIRKGSLVETINSVYRVLTLSIAAKSKN